MYYNSDVANMEDPNMAYRTDPFTNTPPPMLQRQQAFQVNDGTVTEFFPEQQLHSSQERCADSSSNGRQTYQPAPDSQFLGRRPHGNDQTGAPPAKQRQLQPQSQDGSQASGVSQSELSGQGQYDPRQCAVPVGRTVMVKQEVGTQMAPVPVANIYEQPDTFGLGSYGGRLYYNGRTGSMFCFIFDKYAYKHDEHGNLMLQDGRPILQKGNLNMRLDRRDIMRVISLFQTVLDFDVQSQIYGAVGAKQNLQVRANEKFRNLSHQDEQTRGARASRT